MLTLVFVKHLENKEIILQGTIKEGIYVFPSFQPTSYFFANNTTMTSTLPSLNLWHKSFGLVALYVVKCIIHYCNLPHNKKLLF